MAAEGKGAGIWAGSYIEPWTYQACIRSGGQIEEEQARIVRWMFELYTVQGLSIGDFSREKMQATHRELLEERDGVKDLI